MAVAAEGLDGFVLAGGASRRMGTDKALVTVDDEPLVLRSVRALRDAGAGTVTVVGGDATTFRELGLDTVADRWPGEGPLGGLVTALALADGRPAVVLACDLVDPAAVNVVVLADALGPEVDVAVARWNRRRQWLHAAWGPRCGGVLERAFAAGERSVAAAVGDLRVVDVDVPERAGLRDADTPGELAAILRVRRSGR